MNKMKINMFFSRHGTGEKGAGGFTFIEVLIALTLSFLLLAALIASYIQYRHMIESQDIQIELQGNTRAAMHILSRYISMSGYGLDIPNSQLEGWITWVDGFDENPKVVDGANSAPDAISVAGAFRRPTSLAQATTNSNTIVVESGDGSLFNTSNRKLIYVGGLELARVTSISGDRLTISTHPTLSAGLHNSYSTDTPVDLVEVRKFSIDKNAGPKGESCLLMDDHAGSGGYIDDIKKALHYNIAAVGIEDLQVSRDEETVDIDITGVALREDPTYEGHEDHLRRLTVSQTEVIRNLCKVYQF